MPISRRDVLGGTTAAIGIGLAGPIVAATARPPNVIFILADDLGYADLSCTGRPDYKTPNIDRLAAEGMLFRQAYSNSAVCSATRVGLITGRYQNRLPIGLEEPLGERDVGLPPSHPTLPSLLRRVGYGTTLIGKWHMGELPKYGPLLSGYDHFWGFRGGALDYFTHEGVLHKPDLWDDDTPTTRPGYLTDLLGERAVEVIGGYAARRQPFLISLHFNAPHFPWEGPGDEAEAARLARIPTPGSIAHYDGGSQRTFAEMVTRMDNQVGRVLAALETHGLADNTIVVFTSDNGGERYSDVWPFTGNKMELLEGGLRVPAIIRWPGRVSPGLTSEQVMISMDWLPTLLAACGSAPDPAYLSDGINLSDTLAGAPPRQRALFWRYLNLAQEACRVGDWKYLKILDNTFLFNVADDPRERANMKARRPELYADLVGRYRTWDSRMLPLDPQVNTAGPQAQYWADHYGFKARKVLVRPPDH